MNYLWTFGKIYWVFRDNGTKGTPFIAMGFMRQLSEPYFRGSGPQIRIGKYTLQIGLASKTSADSEEDGVLKAMDGYYMDASGEEIGNWP